MPNQSEPSSAAGMRPDTPVAVAENLSLGSHIRPGVLAELVELAARWQGGPAVLLIGQVVEALHAAVRSSLRRRAGRSA